MNKLELLELLSKKIGVEETTVLYAIINFYPFAPRAEDGSFLLTPRDIGLKPRIFNKMIERLLHTGYIIREPLKYSSCYHINWVLLQELDTINSGIQQEITLLKEE